MIDQINFGMLPFGEFVPTCFNVSGFEDNLLIEESGSGVDARLEWSLPQFATT